MSRQNFQFIGNQVTLDPYTQQLLNQNQFQFEQQLRMRQQQAYQQQMQMQKLLQNQQAIMQNLLGYQQMQFPKQQIPQQRPYAVNLKSITLKPLEYYSQDMHSIQYPPQSMYPQTTQAQPISSRQSSRMYAFKREKKSIEVQTEEDITQYEKNKRMGITNTVQTTNIDDAWGPKTQQQLQAINDPNYKGTDWTRTAEDAKKEQPKEEKKQGRTSKPLPKGMNSKQRALINLKLFKIRYMYILFFWFRALSSIKKKRQEAQNNKGAELINCFKEFQDYFKRTCGKAVLTFASTQQNLFITDKRKILEEEMAKRVESLKAHVKRLFSALIQQYKGNEISAETQKFLGSILHNLEFLPQNVLWLFEVNRFEFNQYGQLKGMNETRATCFLITLLIIRLYLFRIILSPWKMFPEQVKKKEQLETNCYIVTSVMYEILMDYIKQKWMKVSQNQAHLNIDLKTRPRELGAFLAERFQLPEDPAEVRELRKLEEPLILGLEKREDLKAILEDDKLFCAEMQKYIEEWSKSIYTVVHLAYIKMRADVRRKEFERRQENIRLAYSTKPELIEDALAFAKQNYEKDEDMRKLNGGL